MLSQETRKKMLEKAISNVEEQKYAHYLDCVSCKGHAQESQIQAPHLKAMAELDTMLENLNDEKSILDKEE